MRRLRVKQRKKKEEKSIWTSNDYLPDTIPFRRGNKTAKNAKELGELYSMQCLSFALLFKHSVFITEILRYVFFLTNIKNYILMNNYSLKSNIKASITCISWLYNFISFHSSYNWALDLILLLFLLLFYYFIFNGTSFLSLINSFTCRVRYLWYLLTNLARANVSIMSSRDLLDFAWS